MFLNALVGKSSAQVGGIPGITRGVSWYKGKGSWRVDSPGILDPRSGDSVQRCLAWLGSSKSEVIGGYDLIALDLISALRKRSLWAMVEDSGAFPRPWNSPARRSLNPWGEGSGALSREGPWISSRRAASSWRPFPPAGSAR